MGMYTEIYVNVDLKEDTPKDIVDVLRLICDGYTPDGFPSRTCCLFYNCSYYTPRTHVSHLTYDEIGKQWSLLGKGDLKNYENEIDYFFTWLTPWVEGEPGDFIGYHRYEEAQEPTLVFLPAHVNPQPNCLMALTSRIEIRADEDFIKALEDLSNLTSKNRADVIRDALSLYSIAIKERIYNHKGIVFQDLTTD
jgi:hypothetical protein